MATRTLTGIEALAAALLREEETVLLDGQPSAVALARVASYERPETVSYEWTPKASSWTAKHVQSLEQSASLPRAKRDDERSRKLAAQEEYVVAANLAREERALWDEQNARLESAGWRESRYDVGQWYKVDANGRAVRTAGRVVTVKRREALAKVDGGAS
jgi:hypothetical protein